MSIRHYHYVIVGGGSAGCVLANRLSEDPAYRVCLLEAGPEDRSPLIGVPGAFAYFMFSRKYNWGFESEPVGDIRHGAPMFCPQGKGLGGGSTVNAMIYIRGQSADYDNWAELGNPGWDFESVLPYFLRSECNERGGDAWHGDAGPLYVSNCRNYYPLNERFLDAARQAGYPLTDDFNGASQEGVGYFQFTIRDGKRCSASHAFLRPARARPNLDVVCSAQATRILFEGRRAVGVEFLRGGRAERVHADREVILSAGAYNSPKLLMLSGVGDPASLAEVGIGAIHDLPGVGRNLQEHVDSCVLQTSLKREGFRASVGGLLGMTPHVFKYLFSRTGKLASSVTQAGGFLKSRDDLDAPDVQLHFVPLLFDDSGRDLKLMSRSGYSCHVCVLRPKSRGRMTLRSADPAAPPRIELNFLSEPEDRRSLVDGIRLARRILAAPAFDGCRGEELNPGPGVEDDDAILARAKQHLGLVYHPVGTCKMGNDDRAVVDHELRVHGLEGLRVVDASIMPTLVSGNTNAPTIMIAEKASDLLLGDG